MPSFSTEKALREYLASPDAILNRYLGAALPPYYDVESPEKILATRDEVIGWLYTLPENSFCLGASIVRTNDGKPIYSDPNDPYTDAPEAESAANRL